MFFSRIFMAYRQYSYFLNNEEKSESIQYLLLLQSINFATMEILTDSNNLNDKENMVIQKVKLLSLLKSLHRILPELKIEKMNSMIHFAFRLNFLLGGHRDYFTLESSKRIDTLIQLLKSVGGYFDIYFLSWNLPSKDNEHYTEALEKITKVKRTTKSSY